MAFIDRSEVGGGILYYKFDDGVEVNYEQYGILTVNFYFFHILK